MGAGVVIAVIASTTILVTQDLEYAVTNAGYIEAIGYRLPALFAQGRIALGGALVALGVLVAFAALFGQSERALWQSVLVAGLALFGGIVGVHLHVGYTTFTHLAPAFIGAVALAAACVLTAAGSFHSGRTAAG